MSADLEDRHMELLDHTQRKAEYFPTFMALAGKDVHTQVEIVVFQHIPQATIPARILIDL